MAFGPAEYFALSLLGLIVLSNLTGRSRLKSLIMMAIGLMLSMVGLDPIGGVERFTFGNISAQGGISFISITTGFFGVAEIFSMMAEGGKKVDLISVKFRQLYPNRKELKRAVPSMLRGSVLGVFVGLLPGPAATMASFLSYGVERRFSKQRDEFGRGAIEGVAGPESANNAAVGGAMIPLLSLGLPFAPATAVLLSGMLLHGVTPGPFLLRDRPDVFWGVIGSFYLGNFMLLILNLPLVGIFANIMRIPTKYLTPAVLILCTLGAYGENSSLFDVWVMLGAGVAGYLLRKVDFEPAPLIVGLVLGTVMERSFRQTLVISRGNINGFWDSSLLVTILLTALFALVGPALFRFVKNAVAAQKS